MNVTEGKQIASGLKIGVVTSRFNEFITQRLLEGAVDAFVRHGGAESDLTLVRVPGAFEIPLALKKMAASGKYQGLVALGAVIRGATPHFDYVSSSTTGGVASVALDSGIPVGFGLLTTESVEQAVERAGSKAGNKGADALLAVVEMINLLKELD